MIQRYEFASDYPIPETERLIWCDWLRRNTIHSDQVVIGVGDGGFVEIDTEARRIRYLAYDVNAEGQRYPSPSGKGASRSVRVVQLEARPSPLPVPA